ncbi:MAG: YkgJ family cysteine cluster protein [Planctomycetaceae bacterium]
MARDLPVELPQIQNWSCHTCGECCKQHGIYVTEEEQARIERQNWTEADGIPAGQQLFVKMPGVLGKGWTRLAHRDDGSCVFLDENGLCRIHGKFGEPAKPLACRIYPYAFHPTEKGLTVSLRFSCPSVVANLGTPVVDQRGELNRLAKLVVPADHKSVPPPMLVDSTSAPWPDVMAVVDALDATLAQEDVPIHVRLLQALHWTRQLGESKLKDITGERFIELLSLLLDEASLVMSEMSGEARPPKQISAVQFRLLAGQYARKDTYLNVQPTWADRWKLLSWGLSFAWGGGDIPAVQDVFKEVPFSTLEQSFGPIPEEAEEFLTRYFRVKIQGLHFCGPAYYNQDMLHGFNSLVLVYPVVMWIARWLAASANRQQLTREDVLLAITIADHHHGYSPALNTWAFRSRVRTLVQMNEVATLVRWYSR